MYVVEIIIYQSYESYILGVYDSEKKAKEAGDIEEKTEYGLCYDIKEFVVNVKGERF